MYTIKPLNLICALILSAAFHVASAQCNPIPTADSMQLHTDGPVSTMTVSGNTLYIGGQFYNIGKYTGSFAGIDTGTAKVVTYRWPQIKGYVDKIIPDNSGGWILGGIFSRVGDSVRSNLAQIDSNGHVTAFHPNPDNQVLTMALRGNSLYVSGFYTHMAGVARAGLAKINLATGVVNAWNPNPDGVVKTLDFKDNLVYTGGVFTHIGGAARNFIAAIDTGTAIATSWNPGCDGMVSAIAIIDGRLYAGGNFNTVGGITRNHLARIRLTTGVADGWIPGISPTMSGFAVNKIIQNGANVIVCGVFGIPIPTSRMNFAEFDTAAGGVTALDPMPTSPSIYQVFDAIKVGNKLYLDCPATLTDGSSLHYLSFAVVDIPSGTFSWLNCNNDRNVQAECIGFRNGVLYAGGGFNMMGCTARDFIAGIDINADTVTAFEVNHQFNADMLSSIAVSPSRIYIAGPYVSITTSTSYSSSVIAADPVTGVIDSGFTAQFPFGSRINTMLYDAGKLYVGGTFISCETYSRYRIARLSAINGSLDLSWNPGYYSAFSVNAIVNNGSDIIVGGQFDHLGTFDRKNLCAISKATGHATGWDPNVSDIVYTLAANSGKLYVGGHFDSISHIYRPNLGRFSFPSLTLDSRMPRPNNVVNVIKPFHNSQFVSGGYDHINAAAINGLGQLNDLDTIPHAWNPSVGYDSVMDMAVYHDKLFVGGTFLHINGSDDNQYFLRYEIPQLADTVAVTGTDTVCVGQATSFTAYTGVTGSTYKWLVNGTHVGVDADTFSYVPSAGDIVYCRVIPPSGGCYTSDSGISIQHNMVVHTPTVPTISLSSSGAMPVGSTVTITATIGSAGSSYTIFWYLNGAFSGTTTTASFNFTKGPGDDVVHAVIYPNGCYDTATSSDVHVLVAEEGVNDVRATTINFYPNPVSDYLFVGGILPGDNVAIYDATGRNMSIVGNPIGAGNLQ